MLESIIAGIIAAIVAGIILDWLHHWKKKKPSVIAGFIGRLFSKDSNEKILIYLSSGGTCRDPMAKAITLKELEKKELDFRLRVEGMGLGPLSSNNVSFAAIHAIKELYNEDLLQDYKPEQVSKELLDEADLILVMDHSLMKHKLLQDILPRGKTYVFKEFFGLRGDITDPYPDGKDQETLSEYFKCASEIRSIIKTGLDRLLGAL